MLNAAVTFWGNSLQGAEVAFSKAFLPKKLYTLKATAKDATSRRNDARNNIELRNNSRCGGPHVFRSPNTPLVELVV